MADTSFLIGDIGGTNARLALGNTGEPGFSHVVSLECADFACVEDAIQHYLQDVSGGKPEVFSLAAAGPVVGSTLNVTNNHWLLDAGKLANHFDARQVRLINDFEALAYSIPQLGNDDCESIGGPAAKLSCDEDFMVAIVGPGTGLGAAGLMQRGGALIPVVGEGGHIGFAPQTDIQTEVFKVLLKKFGRVTVEAVISGPGIENIYSALTMINDDQCGELSAREIFVESVADDGTRAGEATDLFFEILGQVAGDLVLALGAVDGVYVAGGMAKRYPDLLRRSKFRVAFENKGKHVSYMKRIPSGLITYEEPGLLGAAYCASGGC